MIIEIKDLPNGRTVKRINVDVSFEEDGTVQTEVFNSFGYDTQISPASETHKQSTSESKDELGEESNEKITKPDVNVDREEKPIPTEMTDLEL